MRGVQLQIVQQQASEFPLARSLGFGLSGFRGRLTMELKAGRLQLRVCLGVAVSGEDVIGFYRTL
jgi:hypothetical protein